MIITGIDYYPEHWAPSLWEEDAGRMAAAGIKLVRIGEFAWSRMEPRDGEFDFTWLDRAVEIISSKGMKVIMCTPTNCAPVWLYRAHPDTLQCDMTGKRTETGIRGSRCLESKSFRHYAGRITAELARRYAGRPEIYAWQLDNELENNHCCCPECTAAFRNFLREKYNNDISLMNKTWGNDVWSGEFSDFDEIELRRLPDCRPGWYNPAFMLDYERFGAASLNGYIAFQRDIIRKYDPDALITTNACFCSNLPDFHSEFSGLDSASYDNYPPIVFPDDPEEIYSNAFALDFVRGFKRKNFWVMEQLGGPPGCWSPMAPAMEPGMLESYALQAVSHGADLVSFFRWRTARSGAEMFCHGILDHDNRRNRRLEELEDFTRRIAAIPELEGTEVVNRIAVLYSSEQEFAFKNQFQSPGFEYWYQLKMFHNACLSLGQGADIIHEGSGLEGYSLVIVPSHTVTDPGLAERLEEFASSGGTVIITCRSGVKDKSGNCITGSVLPGAFSGLCGCAVKEYDPIGRGENAVSAFGRELKVSCWCDILEAGTAEVVGTYTGRFYSGAPAITRRSLGSGCVIYAGTIGGKAFYRELMRYAMKARGMEITENIPENLEISRRSGKNGECVFLFNNSKSPVKFEFKGEKLEFAPLETKIICNGEYR